GVRSLAEEAAELARGGAVAAPDGGAGAVLDPAPALECLRTSGAPVDETNDRLVRLIQARYDGTPAYLAVFLESPGADQPADTAVVWVAAKADCRILDTASLRV
ncbi:MAG TPA: hypothetical protein VLA90_10725, partial [Actinomycetota bacterium]|nr:hypothetical protein [Actinomycetota bacterium]